MTHGNFMFAALPSFQTLNFVSQQYNYFITVTFQCLYTHYRSLTTFIMNNVHLYLLLVTAQNTGPRLTSMIYAPETTDLMSNINYEMGLW